MSRVLDYNNLSRDDIKWLKDRGQERLIPKVFTHKDEDPPSPDVPDYTREDYESWKKRDLLTEIKSRNDDRDSDDQIEGWDSKSSIKADLVDILVDDDELQEIE